MTSRFGRRLGVLAASATVFGLVMSGTAAHANQPDPEGLPVQVSLDGQPLPSISPEMIENATRSGATVPLTLVTGDVVHVGLNAEGEPAVQRIEAAPRPDGGQVGFHTVTRDGTVYVIPSDALALLDADVLDWDLFNLAELGELAAEGTTGEVPVIVTHPSGISTRQAPAQVDGVSVERTFKTLDASAMTIEGSTWWQEVSAEPANGPATRSATGALAGVEKIWLNGLSQVTLEDSVPQVGAGVAWANGYDGTGVTVAVLDTGIDPNHPDVAGKLVEQVDFTGASGGAVDGHGHGTHVAATIAGTGEASGGQRPGVAPGADLAIGRVCDPGGSCPNDAVLAGMEWAATSGADVVNMSLGGGATDGTDLLSQTVNQLSQDHGTLFVIAAGNNGPSSYTVGAPGAADEALTVAAVDKTDEMADFSSRGPRVGDDAPKPDIAAPGVDIVAARAEGTSMGTPVDELYTAASGTSMATPHVAGGAAIVAQQNPDLTGSELKALLMATSLDLGHDLYEQGAGRLDMGRAIDPSVFSAGHVNFGRHEYPHQPVSGTAGFINVTDEPITLSVSGSMTSGDGSPAPEGLFALDADEVTVPAQGRAEVGVILDGSVLEEGDVFGSYRGTVEAHDAEGDLRAASRVLAFLEPERFEVTINMNAPDGVDNVEHGAALLAPMDEKVYLHDDPAELAGGETITANLFAGTYAMHTILTWVDEDGVEHTAVPTAPEVKVTGDTEVTLDLNEVERVAVDVGRDAETYSAALNIDRFSATGAWGITTSLEATYGPSEPRWWVLPTERVSEGTLQVTSDHVLVPPITTLRTTGGPGTLTLDARYGTPDVSVPGASYQWTEGEGEEAVTHSRDTLLPLPRLESKRPVWLAYAGTGTADDLAGADLDGKLALITPTDICDTACDFAALRDRVAAAEDAGAIGVLVAGESGQVDLGSPATGTIECADGWESCPAVEPYAALPIMSVPAGQAQQLIDRLAHRPVLARIGGDGELTRAYALSFSSDGRVPGDLPYRADARDLDRVEHRIHDNAPSETHTFSWTRITPEALESGDAAVLGLPNVASQRSMTVFVGPHQDNVLDRFTVGTLDFLEPSVIVPRNTGFLSIQTGEIHELELSGSDTISWNTGPVLPAAARKFSTADGFTHEFGLCSGCREGDTLWPNFYAGSSNGHVTSTLIGLVNDSGVGVLMFGMAGCDPPACDISLYDSAGEEFDQTLLRIQASIAGLEYGEAADTSEEGTSR